jgi:hypothetical protein
MAGIASGHRLVVGPMIFLVQYGRLFPERALDGNNFQVTLRSRKHAGILLGGIRSDYSVLVRRPGREGAQLQYYIGQNGRIGEGPRVFDLNDILISSNVQ